MAGVSVQVRSVPPIKQNEHGFESRLPLVLLPGSKQAVGTVTVAEGGSKRINGFALINYTGGIQWKVRERFCSALCAAGKQR